MKLTCYGAGIRRNVDDLGLWGQLKLWEEMLDCKKRALRVEGVLATISCHAPSQRDQDYVMRLIYRCHYAELLIDVVRGLLVPRLWVGGKTWTSSH